MEKVVTLTMNKSSQVTIPVALKNFLGLGETGTITARMRRDGTVELSREKTIDEIREEAFAKMSHSERRRVEKRAKAVQETFPDLQSRIAAEKNWMELDSVGSSAEYARRVKKYGKF